MLGKMILPRKHGLRRRASTVCVDNDRMLMVRLKDPHTGFQFLSPPGGAINPDETPLTAAIRETKEETGYVVELSERDLTEVVVRYDFEWDGAINACETVFFLCELAPSGSSSLVTGAAANEPSYVLGPEWIEVDRVRDVLGYHKAVCEAVMKLLEQ